MGTDSVTGKFLRVFPLLTTSLVRFKWTSFIHSNAPRPKIAWMEYRRVPLASHFLMVALLDAAVTLILQPSVETYVISVLGHAGTMLSSIAVVIRGVLEGLSDAPLGLKLNIPVSSMLSDASVFLLDVWMTYLHGILPLLRGIILFILRRVCPFMGISLILTVLHDAFLVSTLYLSCFYLYSKTLYGKY